MRDFVTHAAGWLQRPAVAMGLLAALLATQISSNWSPTPDGAGYLSIARSIALGGPIENMGSPKWHYPPGYPLLISPLMWTGDRPLLLLSIAQWLFAVTLMLGVYCWSRRWLGASSLWITALVMANAGLWINARATLSEMSFMALLVWTAWAIDRLAAEANTRRVAAWCILVAAMIVALSMIRPVGILIVTGYAVAALSDAWRGTISWRRALATTSALAAPAALAILALLVHETRAAEMLGDANRTYLDEFKRPDLPLAAQIVEGLRVRISEVGRLLVPGMLKAYAPPGQWLNVNMIVYLPLFGALVWAWWQVARRYGSTLVLMVPCYFGLYVVYPSDQGARYLLPLLPVLFLCVWWLVTQAPRQQVAILSCLVAAHLIVAAGASVQGERRIARINAHWQDIDQLAAVLQEDNRPAVSQQLPHGVRELLLVSANRYIYEPRTGSRIASEAAWLLTQADAPLEPGFRERGRAGDFKLLERIPHASPGSTAAAAR